MARSLALVISLAVLLCCKEVTSFSLHGGIQAMLSEKGLNYIAKVAEEGVPKIFDGLKIPDQEGTGYSIKNLRLFDVSPADVIAQFDGTDQGIVSNATIASIKVAGQYEVGWGFMSTTGNMSADIKGLSFRSTLKLLVGVGGVPVINITTCKAAVRNINASFHTEDLVGSAITSFKDVIEAFLVDSIDWIICSSAQTAVSQYAELMINPPGGVVPTVPPGEAFVLCEDLPPAEAGASVPQGSNMGGMVALPLDHLYVNMSLTDYPTISHNDLDLGFNGSFTYDTHQSRTNSLKYSRIRAPHNRRMVRMVVSDMVANSFFEQVFLHRMGRLEEQLRSSTLEAICSNCYGSFEAELLRPPVMTTSQRQGAWLEVTGWVRGEVTVFSKRIDLLWVDTQIMLSARPYVEHHRLKAEVRLERLNVESDNRAGRLGRVVGFFLKKSSNLASEIIPDNVIPKLEQKLNNALGAGLPLPKVCGLDFYNTVAFPSDSAVIIDTDINYNADPILKQFKKLLETPVAMPARK